MTGKKISICFDELVKLLHRHIGAQKIKRVRVVHREDMLKSVKAVSIGPERKNEYSPEIRFARFDEANFTRIIDADPS